MVGLQQVENNLSKSGQIALNQPKNIWPNIKTNTIITSIINSIRWG